MGRRLLPNDERRSSGMALRMLPSLMQQIEQAIDGRQCNKTELVVGLIQTGFDAGLADSVVDRVEASKAQRQASRSRAELLRIAGRGK